MWYNLLTLLQDWIIAIAVANYCILFNSKILIISNDELRETDDFIQRIDSSHKEHKSNVRIDPIISYSQWWMALAVAALKPHDHLSFSF